ncbi:MAG: HEAT repeat domain-containing protein [Gemmatimonadetes bacterium]|nr:HEAT repeat domain-containing protein [Gemmatimonadota bacterium]MDA1102992.1 HEAT repeat domain-containing protein [Gemmatimonadota bacterium]
MSESVGKKELTGIAGSVQALFSSAAPVAVPSEEASTPTAVEPTVVEVPAFEVPPSEPEVSEAPVVTPQEDHVSPSVGVPPVPNDEERGPLDLAVDAYLAGELDAVGAIRALADSFLAQKAVDPIAKAVGRLAAAAGIPRDESVYAVAESIMSPPVLGRLARRMGSERDETRRKENFLACRVIGEKMAVAIRNDLADSTDRLARRIHYDALIGMGDASRYVIEGMVADENRFLVRNGVAILGEIGGDRAVELVTSALANPDARVRREALLALAKLGDEESGQLVVGFLDDPSDEVKLAAAVASGELKVERSLKALIAMLDGSKDPDTSLPLIRALGQIGDPGAVVSIEKHAVRSFFSKPRIDVRIAAYRALNLIGTPHARRLLNQAVSDKDPEVKDAVKSMLNMR